MLLCVCMQQLCHPVATYLRLPARLQLSKKSVLRVVFLGANPSLCAPFCCSGCEVVVSVQEALVMNMRLVQYDMLGAVYRAG